MSSSGRMKGALVEVQSYIVWYCFEFGCLVSASRNEGSVVEVPSYISGIALTRAVLSALVVWKG